MNLTRNLYLTSGGRIVLDDHSNEAYNEPSDAVLLTKEELTNGIFLPEFLKRIGDTVFDREDYLRSRFHYQKVCKKRRKPRFHHKLNWKKFAGTTLKDFVLGALEYYGDKEGLPTWRCSKKNRQYIRMGCHSLAKRNNIPLGSNNELDKRIGATIRHEIWKAKKGGC